MTLVKQLKTRLAMTAILASSLAANALAGEGDMTPIPAPAQPDAITLDTGVLPGAAAPESWHRQYGSVFARNVTVATLTPVLPPAAKATGAAVIVAPGAVSARCRWITRAGRSPGRWRTKAWRRSC